MIQRFPTKTCIQDDNPMPRNRLVRTLALAAALLGPALPASAAPLVIYADALAAGWQDWSWATHNLGQTGTVHGGTKAISMQPDNWEAVYLHNDAGIDVAAYDALEVWVHGGPNGGQKLAVVVTVGGQNAGSGDLDTFVAGGAVPAGRWAKAHIPFSALGVSSGLVDGFWLQDATGGNQAAVYLDDIVAVERTGPTPTPAVLTVQIDPNADRRPVSPWIYGVNFGDATQLSALHFPVRRWGGNSVTRYSWEDDISNKASDWFFYNIENDNPNPGALPDGSASDSFVAEATAAGSEVLLTVPTIGWTPRDRNRRWGFSVAKYGAQQNTECTVTGFPSWCNNDAGNGIRPNGTLITGNDPTDTSRVIGPDFVTRWMQHLSARNQSVGQGRVRLYALDNEPMLWNSTHRDVHPQPLSYDELWQRTQQYAAAIKAQDPQALVFGPAEWGWCAYFGSAVDAADGGLCTDGSDRQAHGGVPLLQWYLQKVSEYQATHGVRLVDYLDIHYYPQADGVALSGEGSASVQAKRLRSVKSLYDPSYTDESWIGDKVRLIPRMKEWIAANAPGVKLAITEYNWGDDNAPSAALAEAEVLAVFGREGVDLATRWVAPEPGSLVEDTFRLYLNYDGTGSHVEGESVRAISSNVDQVGAYAIRSAADALYVLLFNKNTASIAAQVSVAGGLNGPVRLYRFDPSHRLGPAGQVSPSGGGFSVTLPARSATLAVARRDTGSPTPTPLPGSVGAPPAGPLGTALFVLLLAAALVVSRRPIRL
jgi:glycosyl hydrolase family 44